MKKSVLFALTACASSCAHLSAMEQPVPDQSIVLFKKYIAPDATPIEYADLQKFRTIFKEDYPQELSVLDLQKRLIACCALQGLRQMEGHDYSDDRQTLQTKLLTLFPGKVAADHEVRSALLYLLPEKGELKNETDYSNYLPQLVQDIKNINDKLALLNNHLGDKKISIPTLQEILDEKNEVEKQSDPLLAQHQAIKAELEISIPIHQLAHKLLIKRLTNAQKALESWINWLEQDVQDMESDSKSQGTPTLKEFKSRLHTAKKTLAYSKGEGSRFKDWITGY